MMGKHLVTVKYEIEIEAQNGRVIADIVGRSLPRGARLTGLRFIDIVPEEEVEE